MNKNEKIFCPVCSLPFNNRYCLSNHIYNRGNSVFLDKKHEEYWIEKKKKEKEQHEIDLRNKINENKCIRCGNLFFVDFEHRFKKRCDDCEKKYPRRKKQKSEVYQTKNSPCNKCGKIITVRLFSSTHVCDDCHNEKNEEKKNKRLGNPLISNCSNCGKIIIKNKNYLHDHGARRVCDDCKSDDMWFKKHNKYNEVIELLSTTSLNRYEIVKKLDLSHDFVREAAIDKFGQNWYNDRLKMIDQQTNIKISKSNDLFYEKLRKNEKKFKKFFAKRNFKFKSSSIEKMFVQSISNKNLMIETNKWLSFKIDNKYEHREIDVKVQLNNRKFAIFIDGEAFHGKNSKSCFKTPTIELDSKIAMALSNIGYFSIRYSETEIKEGWAVNHFLQLYEHFKNNEPKFYYRNWMTEEELIKY
jgi:hypothetical protein